MIDDIALETLLDTATTRDDPNCDAAREALGQIWVSMMRHGSQDPAMTQRRLKIEQVLNTNP